MRCALADPSLIKSGPDIAGDEWDVGGRSCSNPEDGDGRKQKDKGGNMPEIPGGYDLFAVVEGTSTIDRDPLFPGAGIVRSDGLDRLPLNRQRITHEPEKSSFPWLAQNRPLL